MVENNCATCEYRRDPQGGHCYMFRAEPEYLCMQHQDRRPKRVVPFGLTAVIAATLAAEAERKGDVAAPAISGQQENKHG